MPGSQVELAIVTNTFVKIYDLSLDAISPSYYFIVCSGKIRDACVCVIDGVRTDRGRERERERERERRQTERKRRETEKRERDSVLFLCKFVLLLTTPRS